MVEGASLAAAWNPLARLACNSLARVGGRTAHLSGNEQPSKADHVHLKILALAGHPCFIVHVLAPLLALVSRFPIWPWLEGQPAKSKRCFGSRYLVLHGGDVLFAAD